RGGFVGVPPSGGRSETPAKAGTPTHKHSFLRHSWGIRHSHRVRAARGAAASGLKVALPSREDRPQFRLPANDRMRNVNNLFAFPPPRATRPVAARTQPVKIVTTR